MSTDSTSDSSIDWKNKILNKRYIPLKKLDHGAYASVWMSFDTTQTKYCAIKINNTDDEKAGKRETKMYDIFKKYKSSSLMSITDKFDHTTVNGIHHCCVMDLMACSLYSLIKSKKYYSGLNFETVVKIIFQVLKGIANIHGDNIIHGDIKPENILLCGNSNSQIKLFEIINVDKIVSDLKVEIKLETIKNRKNKQNKQNNNAHMQETYINKLAEKITKKMNLDDLYETNTIDNSDDESDDEIKEDSDSNNTSSSEKSSKLTISSCDDDEYIDSDSDYDSDSDSLSEYDDNLESGDEEIVAPHIIDDIKVKISDMGGCLLPHKKRHRHIQTCYYRSPEILLGFDYGIESDMWALGCTIYELLTGKILFNPNDYKGNVKRHHVYLITKKLGSIPIDMVKKSPKRDIFFTANNKLIKGYNSIDFSSTLKTDLENIAEKNKITPLIASYFFDFMLKLFNHDPSKRLTVSEALVHPLFTTI